MKEKTMPDPQKVFAAIAMIISRRGEGNVSLISVRAVQREQKAG